MRNLLGVLVLGAAVSTAHAGTGAEARVELRASTPTTIEATVDGVPVADVEHVALHVKADPQQAIHPARITACVEPVAVAILYPADYLWIGTDKITTDPNAAYAGRMEQVASVFDQVSLAKRLPRGSKFALVAYGERATTRVPWSPIAQLRGAAFGTQADYPHQDHADFNAGLVAALDELERSAAPRQVLISFDGDEYLEPTAEVDAAVKKAKRRGVLAYTLWTVSDWGRAAEPGHQNRGRGMFELTYGRTMWTTNSTDGIREVLDKPILDRIASCWYATFDVRALHGAQDVSLAINGKDAALTSDGKPTDFVHVLLAPERYAWWTSRLLQVGVGLLLVGLVALALRWRFRAPAR